MSSCVTKDLLLFQLYRRRHPGHRQEWTIDHHGRDSRGKEERRMPVQDPESQRHLMSGRCPQGCGFDSGQDIILSCIHVIPQEERLAIKLKSPSVSARVPRTQRAIETRCGSKISRNDTITCWAPNPPPKKLKNVLFKEIPSNY